MVARRRRNRSRDRRRRTGCRTLGRMYQPFVGYRTAPSQRSTIRARTAPNRDVNLAGISHTSVNAIPLAANTPPAEDNERDVTPLRRWNFIEFRPFAAYPRRIMLLFTLVGNVSGRRIDVQVPNVG